MGEGEQRRHKEIHQESSATFQESNDQSLTIALKVAVDVSRAVQKYLRGTINRIG